MADTNGTLADLWPRAVTAGSSSPAMVIESGSDWREVSWAEADAAVNRLAAGLSALGVERHDRVALLLRTNMDWVVADHALLGLGAVVVPIYPTSSIADAAHILNDSGARVLIAEPLPLTDAVLSARGELHSLETIVGVDGLTGADVDLEEVHARGDALLEQTPDLLAAARGLARPDDVATIVYTSGTTGPPKGCTLTHGNVRSQLEMIVEAGIVRPEDRTVLHLPLAHVLARVIELMCARLSLTLGLCHDTGKLTSALAAVRPTVFVSVPRLFETAHRAAHARVENERPLRRRIGRWAIAGGIAVYRSKSGDGRVGPLGRLGGRAGERLVFTKVRERLGGELRLAISGGAALSGDVAEFFSAAGVPILEGYGLTEVAGVATVNDPEQNVPGTVGRPLPGSELEIAHDGEVLIRGPHVFTGYWGNEDATSAVLESDGWLRTGDIGRVDEGGRLVLVDRKKDIIVTASGKNVSPQNIEAALCSRPEIAQALVVGAERPVIGALIVPDPEAIGSTEPDVIAKRVAEVVGEVNKGLGIDSRVRRHTVLDREFDPERDEVTPTLKLRRRVCEEHFADSIEAMYA